MPPRAGSTYSLSHLWALPWPSERMFLPRNNPRR
jgi:hypothetical protein